MVIPECTGHQARKSLTRRLTQTSSSHRQCGVYGSPQLSVSGSLYLLSCDSTKCGDNGKHRRMGNTPSDECDLLHPACVDVVQVGALHRCLHLQHNSSHSAFKTLILQDHFSSSAECYIYASDARSFPLTVWTEKKQMKGKQQISCAAGMLPL